MFRIKICGLTNVADALAAAEAGADAVGLNFFSGSPRCVSRDIACEIAAATPPEVKRIGVFVNAPADKIRATCNAVGLDAVQLHGDEPPELLAELSEVPVVRAFRLHANGVGVALGWLAACDAVGQRPEMVLVDAYRQGEFGGTGAVADWSLAAELRHQTNFPPLVLAGGLTAENVARAIEQVRPYAVDTASGVERSPGCKDPALLRSFVERARDALTRQAMG